MKDAYDKHSLFKGGITQGSSALYAIPQSKDIQALSKIMSKLECTIEDVKHIAHENAVISGQTHGRLIRVEHEMYKVQADVCAIKSLVLTLGDTLSQYKSDLDEVLDSTQGEHDSYSTLLQQILQHVQLSSGQQSAPQPDLSQVLSEMQDQLQQRISSAVSLASAETIVELKMLTETIQQELGAIREAAADGHAETQEQLAVAVGSVQLRLNQMQSEIQSEVADVKSRADQASRAQRQLVQNLEQEIQQLQASVNSGQTKFKDQLSR